MKKLIIDIPDNELKVPLKNIHLLISDGNVTEVCIKKYDKDKPYFMNLNFALLEESDGEKMTREEREEALDVLTDMANALHLIPTTRQGKVFKMILQELQKPEPDVLDKIKADLWMEGVNMTDEYQGVWVRYRDIERTIDKYKASTTWAERSDKK